MASPIYIIGSSNTDMVVKSAKLPAPGETVLGGTFFMNPGGKGANQAVAAARLGGNVSFIANVGNDLFGKQSIQQFKSERIDTAFISIDANLPSGVALINVDDRGENIIAVAPGSNWNLKKEQIDAALDQLPENGIVLIQLEIPLETVEFAIKKSKEKGHSVILNPAPAQKLPDSFFEGLYGITPNETEATLLTGIEIKDEESLKVAAGKLVDKGVENVIITLGAKGAFAFCSSTIFSHPAPLVKAIDATAAGDCFSGALAVALAENLPIEEAVAFAIKAASISVTRLGAQASIPYRKELNK